jgi:hypothetical protein
MEKYWKYWKKSAYLVTKETETQVECVNNYDFFIGIILEQKTEGRASQAESVEITKAQYERLRKLAAKRLGLIQ